MKKVIENFIDDIKGEILTKGVIINDDVSIEGACISDLLNLVMGQGERNRIWITNLKHINSIAVATLKNIPIIVFSRNLKPEDEIIMKANEENICLVSSPKCSYEIAYRLHDILEAHK